MPGVLPHPTGTLRPQCKSSRAREVWKWMLGTQSRACVCVCTLHSDGSLDTCTPKPGENFFMGEETKLSAQLLQQKALGNCCAVDQSYLKAQHQRQCWCSHWRTIHPAWLS